MPVPASLSQLVDDAAMFPPGNLGLDSALRAHPDHHAAWYGSLVGTFVVSDRVVADLVQQLESSLRISVVVSGGAGAVAPALALADRNDSLELAGLEVALRDPTAVADNASRVTAALDAELGDGVAAYVEMPRLDDPTRPGTDWLAAADVVAAAGHALKFRTGGEAPEAHPGATELATCIDAALERELPFKCTAGLHHAVRLTSSEGYEQHGFLNVLVVTRRLFDGASVAEAVELLDQRDPAVVAEAVRSQGVEALTGARRWFRSFGSCSISDPVAELQSLGLISEGVA